MLDLMSRGEPGSWVFSGCGVIVGPEEHIPDREDKRQVAVAVLGQSRVMNAVHLRRQQQPAQWTEPDANVHVRKECERDCSERDERCDYWNRLKQIRERRDDGNRLERCLQPMMPVRRRDIQMLLAMMQFVLSPKPHRPMLQAVPPITEEVDNGEPNERAAGDIRHGDVFWRRER